jgi:hypothetical protein
MMVDDDILELDDFDTGIYVVDENLPLELVAGTLEFKSDSNDFIPKESYDNSWFTNPAITIKKMKLDELEYLIARLETNFKLQATFKMELMRRIAANTITYDIFVMFEHDIPFYGVMTVSETKANRSIMVILNDIEDPNVIEIMLQHISNTSKAFAICCSPELNFTKIINRSMDVTKYVTKKYILPDPTTANDNFSIALTTTDDLFTETEFVVDYEYVKYQMLLRNLLTVWVATPSGRRTKFIAVMKNLDTSSPLLGDAVSEVELIPGGYVSAILLTNQITDEEDIDSFVDASLQRVIETESNSLYFANISELEHIAFKHNMQTIQTSKTSTLVYK